MARGAFNFVAYPLVLSRGVSARICAGSACASIAITARGFGGRHPHLLVQCLSCGYTQRAHRRGRTLELDHALNATHARTHARTYKSDRRSERPRASCSIRVRATHNGLPTCMHTRAHNARCTTCVRLPASRGHLLYQARQLTQLLLERRLLLVILRLYRGVRSRRVRVPNAHSRWRGLL